MNNRRPYPHIPPHILRNPPGKMIRESTTSQISHPIAALALITSINPSYSRRVGLAASYKWRSAGVASSLSHSLLYILISNFCLRREKRAVSGWQKGGGSARASSRTTLDLITVEKETDPGTAAALRVSEERDDWELYGAYRFYCTVSLNWGWGNKGNNEVKAAHITRLIPIKK